MNEEVNQKNITCSNTCNNVDYVTIETLLGDTMTYEEYINSLNKRNLVSVDRLQNNWNELKEWAEERIKNANEYLNDPDKNWDEDANGYVLARKFQLEETLKKMQELECNND